MGDILKDIGEAEARIHRGPVGCVERIALNHPDLLDDALRAIASTYQATTVSRVLKSRGVDISDYTILRHRRSACRCPEEYRG